MPEGVYLYADLADSSLDLAKLLKERGYEQKAGDCLVRARKYLEGIPNSGGCLYGMSDPRTPSIVDAWMETVDKYNCMLSDFPMLDLQPIDVPDYFRHRANEQTVDDLLKNSEQALNIGKK